MPTKILAIDLIQVLGTVQPRQTLNEDAIADYAEHYKPDANGKAPLPPLRCFWDGERYILSRGFHRVTAAQRAKRASLEFEVMDGDERAAILDAMLDNDAHGVRLTPADKRKAVNRLLDDPEWGKLSQTRIAELANVSRQFVAMLIIERKPKSPPTGMVVNDNMAPGSGERKKRSGVKGGVEAVADSEPIVLEKRAQDARKKADAVKTAEPEIDRGKCPNCAGVKWNEDDDGVYCAKCNHPYGEPVGDVDDKRIKDQRSKTIKTAEALLRAFDDLHTLLAKPNHAETIATCKGLIKTARGWK
jgi:hypothetical protein